jgi:GNAT superfamily N-acetyltransferase
MSLLELHRGTTVLEELAPLWLALFTHHQQIEPALDYQTPELSWSLRRAEYKNWLTDPRAFVVLARDDAGRAVGYALTVVHDGPDDTWTVGDCGEVKTLSVAPQARGRGLGTALLDAVEAELERIGIADLQIMAIAANRDALRFYSRRGLTPRAVLLSRYRSAGQP